MKHKNIIKDIDKAEYLSEVLKALAHPLRIRIVALLCEEPEHVNGLAERLDAQQAIVSQQLRILRMRGLVKVIREQGFAYYHLAEPQLRELIGCLSKCKA